MGGEVLMDDEGQGSKTGWLDPAKQEVIVRVLNTDMRGWILTVPPGTSVIGREPDCQLHLPHYTISRRHCSLQVEQDHIGLRDLNSMNGTMLNGSPCIDAELHPGDNVRVGEVDLGIDVREHHVGHVKPSAPQRIETVVTPPPQAMPSMAPAPPPASPGAQPSPPEPSAAEASTSDSPEEPAPPLLPSQYSYHLPTPSWAVRPHVGTVRYREAKRTMRFDPARRDAFRQFHSS